LSRQNLRLKTDISTGKLSAAKDKKLAELSGAVSCIAAENGCTQKLDELKTRTGAGKATAVRIRRGIIQKIV
jgi:hypothetical protein